MPKIVEYPLAPFDKVIKLCEVVDYLGGSCTIQDCAGAMKKKVTGGFGILISSAIKHDLIIRRRDRLLVSDRFNKIKLSYNAAEKLENQVLAFFHPALYQKIFARFGGKELPVTMLDKLLIREFEVDPPVSEKIAGYFMEGVRQLHLLKDGKLLMGASATANAPAPGKKEPSLIPETEHMQGEIQFQRPGPTPIPHTTLLTLSPERSEYFVVSVKGQGIDSTVVVYSKDDLSIIEALLGRIRKSV